jgi:formate hydrogenlyase subunit 3/multisubunit Na+/H+ antiporter MnhD subunit
MPHITFAMAMGLSLVISLFKTTNVNDIKKEYKEENTKYVLLLTPWLLLLLGWIIKLIIY